MIDVEQAVWECIFCRPSTSGMGANKDSHYVNVFSAIYRLLWFRPRAICIGGELVEDGLFEVDVAHAGELQ